MKSFRSLFILALGVAGLGAAPANAQDTLRIGAPLPLTGALAPEGAKLKQGYELWQEKVNAAGGIKAGDKKLKIDLVYYDYQSTTPKAVQLAEKLISDDKVDFLFSPFGSGAAKAVSAVAEKYGVPLLASSASSAEVFDQVDDLPEPVDTSPNVDARMETIEKRDRVKKALQSLPERQRAALVRS